MPVQTLRDAYEARLRDGWEPDPAQEAAVSAMNRILMSLASPRPQPIKGLYLYGPVGRGKTQLLNMFMERLDPARSRRTHMHAFMAEINQRVFEIKTGDPVIEMARRMSEDHRVLGFDEFYVSNIADGMLLGRLFQQLFRRGVVVVATSNWPITDLYRDGRNRKSFLPFIRVLEANMQAVDLGDGQDYRQVDYNHWPLYFLSPASSSAPELGELFMAYGGEGESELPEGIKAEATRGRCAWFHFRELLEQPLGRREFLDLTERFDTLIIEGVPVLTPAYTESSLRLITLIDVCYEHRCRVIVSAEGMPEELCPEGPAAAAFSRVTSRLTEMQTWI